MIVHTDYKEGRPYDIKKIKDLPLEEKIDKIIDIIDFIQNHSYNKSTDGYYIGLTELLNQ